MRISKASGIRRQKSLRQQGLNDPKNDLFFVGYQAKGTPGRRMMGKKIPVKAAIHTLSGYSAHADQTMLVNWVKSMPEPPKKITLVHGEARARKALAKALAQALAQALPQAQPKGSGLCSRRRSRSKNKPDHSPKSRQPNTQNPE